MGCHSVSEVLIASRRTDGADMYSRQEKTQACAELLMRYISHSYGLSIPLNNWVTRSLLAYEKTKQRIACDIILLSLTPSLLIEG